MINPTKKISKGRILAVGRFLLPLFSVVIISATLTALIWNTLSPNNFNFSSYGSSPRKDSLFALNYPANGPFQRELVLLKNKKELKDTDELEIHRVLLASSSYLDIPAALLWCLLFQESRLNHLEGIELEKPSSGLGQFSRFSFFEINSQLAKFSPEALNLFYVTFGSDIRPIAAKRKDPLSPSSYYSIPTAVTSSAIYLHNRYFQLSKLLEKRSITYNPDILWLFAAMAYNKGSRSVLTLWNTIYRKNGAEKFTELLNNYDYFRNVTENSALLSKSLKKIWNENQAKSYSNELRIHTKNISSCSISPRYQPIRSLTEESP